MKTYFKYLAIITSICFILAAFIPAVINNTSKMLTHIDWVLQGSSNNGFSIIEKYSIGYLTTKFVQDKDTTTTQTAYYLSDTLVSLFNPQEAGAYRRGEYKYIILEDGERSIKPENPTLIYKIITLNSDSLVLQFVPQHETILEKAPIVYKPLKK